MGRLYDALYDVPFEHVAEGGRLRGIAVEVRDRGATDDPDGLRGRGDAYWPEVARRLRQSYRSLREVGQLTSHRGAVPMPTTHHPPWSRRVPRRPAS
jgi:hypothetical protein